MSDPSICLRVKVKKLHSDAIVPTHQHLGDAGFDFHALRDTEIPPNAVVIVPTGLAMELPEHRLLGIPVGFELQIRPRSGIALKYPLIIANAPGTVDSGYRGEIGIIMRNIGNETVVLQKGMRIAQGVLAPFIPAGFMEVAELSESERGEGGFGSTGE